MDATIKGESTMTTIKTAYRKAHSLATMIESWKAGKAPTKAEFLRASRELLAENEIAEIVPGKFLSNLLDVAEYVHNEDREGFRNWFFNNLTSDRLDVSLASEYSLHVLCG
jgi:hypothetical protein